MVEDRVNLNNCLPLGILINYLMYVPVVHSTPPPDGVTGRSAATSARPALKAAIAILGAI